MTIVLVIIVAAVVVVIVAWMTVLVLRGAYDTRILGVGSEEFKRIVSATATVFGAVAIVVFALKLDLSRGFVLITFSLGLLLLLAVMVAASYTFAVALSAGWARPWYVKWGPWVAMSMNPSNASPSGSIRRPRSPAM